MKTRSTENNRVDGAANQDKRDTEPFDAEGSRYEIRVRGQLGREWSNWFEGLELVHLPNGNMVLSGRIVDQAALIGILNKLNRLNLALLSIQSSEK